MSEIADLRIFVRVVERGGFSAAANGILSGASAFAPCGAMGSRCAEAEVSRAGQLPQGRLRVNCVTAFALHQLMPTLPDFLGRFPEVDLELA
jgi:DNA-binding transcriptional LysR family regulator